MPKIGTRPKRIKDRMNKGTIIFFKKLVSIKEIKIIIVSDREVKTKCLEKKK